MAEVLDENEQKFIIEAMVSEPSIFSRAKPILKAEYFDKKFQPTINYLLDFSSTYSALPVFEQLNAESRMIYNRIDGLGSVNVQASILDIIEHHAKVRALEIAVQQAYQMIANGETQGIDKIIKEAQMISLKRDYGINFWFDSDEWLTKIEEELGVLPTGWKTFDDLMNGGLGWGQLNYVVSPANGGKSLCLANMALMWSMQGYNVMYFTLEMDKELVGKRMASMATAINYRDIRGQIKGTSERIAKIRLDTKPGILQIIDVPIGCTSNDIEGYIQGFEISTGIIPEIIAIDYAGIMKPSDRRIDPNRIDLCDASISLDLRHIARERTHIGKKTMVITASQITKDSMNEMEFSLNQVNGGTTKTHNADNIFTVATNDAMRQRGEYEFKIIKARNAGCKDKKFKMKFNVDTLLISDLEEVQVTNPVFDNNQNLAGALLTLKNASATQKLEEVKQHITTIQPQPVTIVPQEDNQSVPQIESNKPVGLPSFIQQIGIQQ